MAPKRDTPKDILLGTDVTASTIVRKTKISCEDEELTSHVQRPWCRAWLADQVECPLMGGDASAGGATVVIPDELSARHSIYCGSSGFGKSRTIVHIIRETLARGMSVVLVDPKGETMENVLADAIAMGFPPEQTIVLDSHSPVGVPGFNPLLADLPLNQAVADLVNLLSAAFSSSWGPRLADLLTNALVILAAHRLSLYELQPILLHDDYREWLLARPVRHGDPFVIRQAVDYFRDEFAGWGKGERTGVVSPVLNKTRELMRPAFLRSLICSERNTLNLGELWHTQKLVLLRLDQPSLGDTGMRLLAGLLTQLLFRTAMRASGPRKVLLAVDELPQLERFVGGILNDIVTVARSQGLRLMVACQHLEQVSSKLQKALLANTAVKLFFHLGDEDAKLVATHLAVASDAAVSKVTLECADYDEDTDEPITTEWWQPLCDAKGRRLQLSADAFYAVAERFRQLSEPFADIRRLAKLSGLERLYVRAADTGEPVPLDEYIADLDVDEYDWRGPELWLGVTFPLPKVVKVEHLSQSDARRGWWRCLTDLPIQHAAVQLARGTPRIVKLCDVTLPRVGDAAREAFLTASIAKYGQTAEQIAATLAAREHARENFGRRAPENAAPDATNADPNPRPPKARTRRVKPVSQKPEVADDGSLF